MKLLIATTIATALLTVPALADTGASTSATFVDQDGAENGSATLTQVNAGVLIELDLRNLPPESWVAFHIHEDGTCDPADDHDSAGGHYTATGAAHGFLADGGPHEGDMPNQYVPADGMLRAQVLNTFVTLDGGDAAVRGRSLMIHADPDDYESQPAGDAGARIACAVID